MLRGRSTAIVRAIPHRRLPSSPINAGLSAHDPASLNPCTYSPAGDGIVDSIEARFTHPDIDAKQPLYSLEAFRAYPDAVQAAAAAPAHSRSTSVRRELFRTYGKPIDERRERIVSSAASADASLGVARKVKREDYLVRYLWAAQGRLADVEHGGCRVRLRGALRQGRHRDLAVAVDDTEEHLLRAQRQADRRGPHVAPPTGRLERPVAAQAVNRRRKHSRAEAPAADGMAANPVGSLLTLIRHFLYWLYKTKHRSIEQNRRTRIPAGVGIGSARVGKDPSILPHGFNREEQR